MNVGSDTLSRYVWLNDEPILGVSQFLWARAANVAVCAIGRLEPITTAHLIVFGLPPLPFADGVRRFTRKCLIESELRFGLAFDVRIEKLVRDQHPMIVM
jgi:hypothetical protein